MRELRAAGRRAFAVSAAELRRGQRRAKLGDAFVMVSQSGASVETVDALEHIGRSPVVAISANGDSPLARAANVWLPLGPLPTRRWRRSPTPRRCRRSGCCATRCSAPAPGIGLGPAARAGGRRDRTARMARRRSLSERFAVVRALDAVGGGPAQASAGETALLAREALRLPAMGMETREYLHGPLEAVTPEFGCVVFGRDREQGLAAELGVVRRGRRADHRHRAARRRRRARDRRARGHPTWLPRSSRSFRCSCSSLTPPGCADWRSRATRHQQDTKVA